MKKKGKGAAGARRAGRLAAVQALYQMEMTGAHADQVIAELASGQTPRPDGEDAAVSEIGAPDPALFGSIVRGVAANRAALRDFISGALTTDWSVERLDILVRLILEAAIFELTERPDIPPRVVINEYLEMAHAFFDGAETALVNGVLDSVAHAVRGDEMTVPTRS